MQTENGKDECFGINVLRDEQGSSPETDLPINTIIEEGELKPSNLKKISENDKVKVVNEEPPYLYKNSDDSEIQKDLLNSLFSEASNDELLRLQCTSPSSIAREISDHACLSYIEEPAEGSSALNPDLLNAINCMQVQQIRGCPFLHEEQAGLNNVPNDDETLIARFASVQDKCKQSLQKTEQVIRFSALSTYCRFES